MRLPTRRAYAMMLLVVIALSGCGGGAGHSSQSTTAATGTQVMDQMLAVAQCARRHGVPNWPDPVMGPLGPSWPNDGGVSGLPPATQQACKTVIGQMEQDGLQYHLGEIVRGRQMTLEFARCMRSHGLPSWPDPDAQGTFQVDPATVGGGKAATYAAALQACQKDLPFGTSGLGIPQPGTGAHA